MTWAKSKRKIGIGAGIGAGIDTGIDGGAESLPPLAAAILRKDYGMEIGVDVGGTFTDLAAVDPEAGTIQVAKVPTTPSNQADGFMAAVAHAGIDIAQLGCVVHGTTVAVNALIERKGCAAGLITTKGFRDVLELRRRDRPSAYGLRATFTPLIPRHRRLEVATRLDTHGAVLARASDQELAAVVAELERAGTEALVVSLFNGYQNAGEEEELGRRLIALGWPEDRLTLATAISQEAREFERTTTAAINAYVQPGMSAYLERLASVFGEHGFEHALLVAQSNGGAVHWSECARFPVNSILSGPAAGVIAAASIAREAGFSKALSCDIGGTSCDISLIDGGLATLRAQSELEFGLPIWRPMVDVRSIGAGGGSVAWIDRGGFLRVGPRSAGAEPGPACYGKGGDAPTLTDAHMVLGRLSEGMTLGTASGSAPGTNGRPGLRREPAQHAIEGHIASALDLPLEEAAQAIVSVTEQGIIAALRRISTERGHDPREFVLVLFGGAGALHACSLMRELSVAATLIPPFPGATSALGCLLCDLRQDFVQTVSLPLADESLALVRTIWERQRSIGQDRVAAAGTDLQGVEELFFISGCYQGQAHSVEVPVASTEVRAAALEAAFTGQYEQRFSTTLSGFPILITGVRTTVRGIRTLRSVTGASTSAAQRQESRPVRFGGSWHEAAVLSRGEISPGTYRAGPCVIEQSDTTIWIEPGFSARALDNGSLLIQPTKPKGA